MWCVKSRVVVWVEVGMGVRVGVGVWKGVGKGVVLDPVPIIIVDVDLDCLGFLHCYDADHHLGAGFGLVLVGIVVQPLLLLLLWLLLCALWKVVLYNRVACVGGRTGVAGLGGGAVAAFRALGARLDAFCFVAPCLVSGPLSEGRMEKRERRDGEAYR